jgi:hypothetical protein
MLRSLSRFLVLPLAVASTAAVVPAIAGQASAATSIVSGTGTFTVPITPPTSFTSQSARAGIAVYFAVPASEVTFDGTTATFTYTVTGGDAQVSDLSGSVAYGSSLEFSDIKTGKSVTFSSLRLDMSNAQFDGTSSVNGSPQPIFDTTGNVVTSQTQAAQTYSADSLQIDATAASYLNTVLKTRFFKAGQVVGSFSTSYTY